MLELTDLGLTVFQATEVHEADPSLVTAWLEAAGGPNVRSPKGFFLAGVRSGTMPRGGSEEERAHDVLRVERWIERVGLLYDREYQVEDELFGERGMLRRHADDEHLRYRLLSLWHEHRPRAEVMEREREEDIARCREQKRLREEARRAARNQG